MGSRLSSMLVRDGIVGVKRLEKAFRRQVVYGGNLDTVLLEMGLIAEERLCQYLALSSGLPPASRDELTGRQLAIAKTLIAEDIAGQYRVVPLGTAGEAVRVAVHAPVDMNMLEDLADVVDLPLQPLIVPEYRWHVWFGAVYGGTPLDRFVALAKALQSDEELRPVGKAQSVIVDAPDFDPAPISRPALALEQAAGRELERPAAAVAASAQRETLRILASEAPAPDSATVATPPASSEPRAELQRSSAKRITLVGLTPARAKTGDPYADLADVEEPAYRDTIPPESATLTPIDPVLGFSLREASVQSTGYHLAQPASDSSDSDDRPLRITGPAPDVADWAKDAVVDPFRTLPMPLSRRAPAEPIELSRPRIYTPPSDEVVEQAKQARTDRMRVPQIAYSELPIDAGSDAAPTSVISPQTARQRLATNNESKSTPLAPHLARQVLASADERDAIFMTLLRAARTRCRFAGILTVQGSAVIGKLAIADDNIDTTQFPTILIPLDRASVFKEVVDTKRLTLGPIRGDESLDVMLKRMGGTIPGNAVLVPIIVRDRVVAIVIGHRMLLDLSFSDIADLVELAEPASAALVRAIAKNKAKSDSGRTAAPEPAVKSEPSTPTASYPSVRTTSALAAANVEYGTELSIDAEAPRPIEVVLEEVVSLVPAIAEAAIEEAIERVSQALPLIDIRFPGKLRVDRFNVSGRPLRAAQYGGLLELVVRLGQGASDLVIAKMSASQREVRFYATVCAVELRPREATHALVQRLFDNDFGVRTCAIDALLGYPLQDLEAALAEVRSALHSSSVDRVSAAASAIADLLDVRAVDDLVATMGRGDRFAEHARSALVALTCHDFGTSERRWRRWIDDNRKRHRIEWLIESLGAKEDALRRSAIDELRRISGEYFGYHYDLAKKERDAAALRWIQWWSETGKKRFL